MVCNFEVPSVLVIWFGLWLNNLIVLKLLCKNVWVIKSKRVRPKVRQNMGFVVKEVEEFENFKLSGKLAFYVK